MRAAAAALLVLLLAVPAWGAEPRLATLRLESRAPLVVRGRSFGAREHIVLTAVTADTRRRVTLRADRTGAFKAGFGLRIDRCDRVSVRAVGTRGSRAVLLLQPGCGDDDREIALAGG